MPSTAPQIRVLCLGNDAQLLATRHMVLATRYDAMSIGSFEQLQGLAPGNDFGVVVFCHTLIGPECERSAAFIRQQWPKAKILALVSNSDGCSPRTYDTSLGSLDGPDALLRGIDHLLALPLPKGAAAVPDAGDHTPLPI